MPEMESFMDVVALIYFYYSGNIEIKYEEWDGAENRRDGAERTWPSTRLDIYKHSLRPDVRDCPWGNCRTSRHSGLDPESSSFIADIRLTGTPGTAGRTLFCHACYENLAA
jgi:hypothetical protein